MRTQDEINEQINSLQEERDNLPEYSAFQSNNWKPLDAQIAILKGEKTYEDYQFEDPETDASAYEAKYWLENDGAASLN